MIKQAIDAIRSRALELSLAALGTILLSVALFLENHLTLYVSTTDPKMLARIIALLTATTVYSWSAYFYSKPKLKYDNYLQVFTDRKTGFHYCPPCRNKKPLSPLKKESRGWRCPFKDCGMFYKDPDYKPPQEPPRPSGPHAWMAN
jgi:hypothetical protein